MASETGMMTLLNGDDNDEPTRPNDQDQRKPCNIVKPFGFKSPMKYKDGEVIIIADDEVIVIDDDDEEQGPKRSLNKFQTEQAENSEDATTSDAANGAIQDHSSSSFQKKVEVKLEALSEETLQHYSLINDCSVSLRRNRRTQVLDEKKRKRTSSSDFSEPQNPDQPSTSGENGHRSDDSAHDSADDSDDSLYTPVGPTRRGRPGKKRTSRGEPNYLSNGHPQQAKAVYQNIPLNKEERNLSRINFCTRMIETDFVESTTPPEIAVELCKRYWENLPVRMKRKYLPRSKFAQCYFDDPDTRPFRE